MTALARGLSVLRAFGPQNRPIGNGEIAKRVGLAKPTISRITFTLTELGYLSFDEETGFYKLGPGVLTLTLTNHKHCRTRCHRLYLWSHRLRGHEAGTSLRRPVGLNPGYGT